MQRLAGLPFFEYEEAYMLDRCVGDMVLETTLDLLDELAAELEPAEVGGPRPAEPTAPAPEPTPDKDAGPNTKSPLPVTGGGLLAISVAAMGTAVVARRRR